MTTTMTTLAPGRPIAADTNRRRREFRCAFGWSAAALAVAATGWLTRALPGWVMMWAIAATELYGLKSATLFGVRARGWRVLGYLCAWPGLNAAKFFRDAGASVPAAAVSRRERRELLVAFTKLLLGLALCGWAMRHLAGEHPLAVAWVGMLGMILALHFGLFHVLSWLWRARGVDAPPIMRAPLAATSLAEFWGVRWNLAFADSARRFVFRPLARRWSARTAGLTVFALSGLIHETVLSLPARGGWGGPTVYFLLHAVGLAVEKSPAGRRWGLGHGMRGWLWTMLFAAAPLPLLFHPPFVRRVILPFLETLNHLLA